MHSDYHTQADYWHEVTFHHYPLYVVLLVVKTNADKIDFS